MRRRMITIINDIVSGFYNLACRHPGVRSAFDGRAVSGVCGIDTGCGPSSYITPFAFFRPEPGLNTVFGKIGGVSAEEALCPVLSAVRRFRAGLGFSGLRGLFCSLPSVFVVGLPAVRLPHGRFSRSACRYECTISVPEHGFPNRFRKSYVRI